MFRLILTSPTVEPSLETDLVVLPRRVAISSRMSIVLLMLLILFVQLFAFFVEVVLHLQQRMFGFRVSRSSFGHGEFCRTQKHLGLPMAFQDSSYLGISRNNIG